MFKRIIFKLVPNSYRKLLLSFKILSIYSGLWKSIKTKMCVDAQNKPLSWYTYPAIRIFENFWWGMN